MPTLPFTQACPHHPHKIRRPSSSSACCVAAGPKLPSRSFRKKNPRIVPQIRSVLVRGRMFKSQGRNEASLEFTFHCMCLYLSIPAIDVGLYRTSRPVRKSGKFSKSRLSGNRTFSFPDAGLLTLLKIEEKIQKTNFFQKKNFKFFFKIFYF